MPQVNGLSLLNKEAKTCDPFDDAVSLLRNWYNYCEKKTRLLRDWKSMRLTDAMERDPNLSEISVYRPVVSKVMRTQKQLDPSYHPDRYLRDQLLISINITATKNKLKDRVSRGSTIPNKQGCKQV